MLTTMDVRPDIQEYLEKTMEGGLFVDITMHSMGGTFFFGKDWYAVLDGIVYDVSNGEKYPTGDSLFDLGKDCKRVGKYKSGQIHKRISKMVEYSELKALLKL